MPEISVIIPVFNREDFIIECLDSVFASSFKDFECIVVNDGSSDNTLNILQSYSQKIKIINQDNQGPSSARNQGIRESKGEMLTFLDSDDLWLPEKLATQAKYMADNPECRICYTEEIWYRYGVRVNPHKKHGKHSGHIYDKCLPLCIISPSSVMIHKDVFAHTGLFDESLPACEDYDLWLRIASLYPVSLINEALIIKRNGHANQQSQKYIGMDRFRIKSLVKMLKTFKLNEENYQLTKKILEKKCKIYINGCLKRSKEEEAKFYQNILSELYE